MLGAQSANMVRYEPTARRSSSAPGAPAASGTWRSGRGVALDGADGCGADPAPAAARAVRELRTVDRLDRGLVRELGFRSAVGAPIHLGGAAVGRRRRLDLRGAPFPAGAEQRVADFAELVAAGAGQRRGARELRASRARIVEAGDAARRRLERNLHDGAQQRLVAIALTPAVCERKLAGATRRPSGCSAAKRRARRRARRAARAGPRHPPGGPHRPRAAPALEVLAGRCERPVEVAHDPRRAPARPRRGGRLLHRRRGGHQHLQARARVTRPVERRPRRRPRAGRRSRTTASAAPTSARGSGLRGLRDRVEALGGELALASPAGAGTTLSARLPVA